MRLLFNGISIVIFLFFAANVFVACSDDDPVDEMTEVPTLPSGESGGGNEENNGDEGDSGDNDDNDNEAMERNIIITVNGASFSATLEDNDPGRAFASLLPLTLYMSEMNGNEKYHYLDESLPTESYVPGTIQAGDLMLYGSSCVVLFYETFSSGYSYTRLGRINNPEGLAAAVGSGNVSVTFSVQ